MPKTCKTPIYPLPACTASDANYYLAKAVRLETIEWRTDGALKTRLPRRQKRAKEFSVYIGPELDFNEALDRLFSKAPYLVARCVKRGFPGNRDRIESNRSVLFRILFPEALQSNFCIRSNSDFKLVSVFFVY